MRQMSIQRFFLLAVIVAGLGVCTPLLLAAEWKPHEINLPATVKHPVIACTPAELDRLRAAYRGRGSEHMIVADVVARADLAIRRPLIFPPRGGQHNQWYQCEDCQLALKTVDDTHHQCPKCGKVYSGEPYDDVVFARKHSENLRNMETAAWAFAITEEPKYAEFAAKVLLGYAARYATYPYHSNNPRRKPGRSGGHLAEQTLNEAYMMSRQIAPAYDLIHDSKVLSAADHEAIHSGLLLPILKNIDKHKAGKSNWQTWHNAAMLAAGAVLGEVEWVRKAIADPGNGFVFQMKESVTDDGMWYENSWGYHYYTLSAIVEIVEGARRLGIDLWSHPALKKMFTIPVEYAMPNGSLPRFGDDVLSTARAAASYLEFAWHAYRDPAMLFFMRYRPTWDSIMLGRRMAKSAEPPPLSSKVFHTAGHAILRTKGDAGLAAAITFGPYGGFHGHYDKLSFVFFGNGSELGVDPGRVRSQAYRLPIHAHWYKATLGHNTVLVDRESQKPAAGRLEDFAANEHYAAVVASCNEAYPDLMHRRLFCMTPSYLLVFDELAASQEHLYDWVYHNRGTAVECDAVKEAADLSRAFPGSEYIRNTKVGTTAGPTRLKFVGDQVITHVLLDAAPKTTVLTGDGPCESILDRVPLVMVSRHGTSVRFAAVLEPVATGEPPTVTSVEHAAARGEMQITVRRGEASDVITLVASSAVTVTVGDTTVLTGKPCQSQSPQQFRKGPSPEQQLTAPTMWLRAILFASSLVVWRPLTGCQTSSVPIRILGTNPAQAEDLPL